MIGRLEVLLPYIMYVPADAELAPVGRKRGGYSLQVFPPTQETVDRSILSLESDEPTESVFDGFASRPEPEISPSVTYQDRPTVPVGLLRVDIQLQDELERTEQLLRELEELARDEANSALARLRVLGRGHHVRPITDRTCSRFQFLRDDESRFEPAPPLLSRKRTHGHPTDVLVVPPVLWDAAWALPDDYRPPPWDVLVLDAVALLPDIGPAMVLAYAALESRITSALDVLASMKGVDSAYWDWLNARDHYSKQPSISERFDVLMKWLGGKSLKDDSQFWAEFQQLRDARNSFAHTGVAVIGKKRPQAVTHERALKLVATAELIITWVEALLPESDRRPRLSLPTPSVRITKRSTAAITASLQVPGLSIEAGTAVSFEYRARPNQ